MSGDRELLNYIYENLDMGIKAFESLKKNLEHTENKIKSHVLKGLEEYKEFIKKCDKMRKKVKCDPVKTNIMASIMTKMGTDMEFKRDNSDSKIADMLIQGYTMGLIDIEKKLNMYKKDTSSSVIKLAEDYKKMMNNAIKDVKGFL